MKSFFLIVLLNYIIINSIIILPLKTINKKTNLINTYDFINYFQPNNLYSIIKIGEPSQDLEVLIREEESLFSINSYYCNKKSYYNSTLSKSFKYITTEKDYYKDSLAEETLYMYTDFELKNLKKIDNFKIIYEKQKNQNFQKNNIYNCGTISIELFRYNYEKNKYNFILQLKNLGYINEYTWTIKYIENDENLEGYMIIGDYPHIFDNKKFEEIDLRGTLNNLGEKGWNLEFKNITFNDISLTHYMLGTISFSTNYIIGTEEYKSQIGPNFFRDYIDKNICFDDHSNTHYFVVNQVNLIEQILINFQL